MWVGSLPQPSVTGIAKECVPSRAIGRQADEPCRDEPLDTCADGVLSDPVARIEPLAHEVGLVGAKILKHRYEGVGTPAKRPQVKLQSARCGVCSTTTVGALCQLQRLVWPLIRGAKTYQCNQGRVGCPCTRASSLITPIRVIHVSTISPRGVQSKGVAPSHRR